MSKEWNRASFEANTRPIHVDRDITSTDLVVPRGGSLLVLILACLACGLGLALLFVFWPLMLVAYPLASVAGYRRNPFETAARRRAGA